jgi:hypothetical protein
MAMQTLFKNPIQKKERAERCLPCTTIAGIWVFFTGPGC